MQSDLPNGVIAYDFAIVDGQPDRPANPGVELKIF